MKKRVSFLLFMMLLCFLFSGCGDTVEDMPSNEVAEIPSKTQTMTLGNPSGDTWTVLVYLCGTDLETQYGCASANIAEMVEATQSDNVNVILQTGGTKQWAIDAISSDEVQRWRVIPDDIELVDSTPLTNMGDKNTLGEFLSWGVQTYPADKYACILWDHGGGSVTGIAVDELHGGDTLDLKEMAAGFSMADQQFELIGFDACLMSTLETAAALSPFGRYMVASQEWEPGTGWDYSVWLSFLAENPTAGGLEAGTVICDGFYEKCASSGVESLATLAVTDLSQILALVAAFDAMAAEMKGFTASPEKLQPLTQAMVRAENYGGNNDNEGYTNMVDLGDLTLCAEGVLSITADAVLDSLISAIPYHVEGSGRQKSNGLSVYVPLLADTENMDDYARLAAVSGEYLRFLEGIYDWEVPSGVMIEQPIVLEFPASQEQPAPPVVEQVPVDSLTVAQALNMADYKLSFSTELTEDGYVLLSVDEGAETISSVAYNLFYLDEENNAINFLGSDFDVNSDETGTLYWDNFRNVWPVINENTCSMLSLDWGNDYILYTVPVMVNEVETNLRMLYHADTAEYEIVGTWDGIDETGMSSRNVQKLADGDVVEFLFAAADLDSGEASSFTFGEFTVNGAPVVEEAPLFDGVFYYQYEITDIFGNVYTSDFAVLTSHSGEITVEMP